ncbi:MAG: aminotransferase class I/II-fold pyridoxal phosphate-dependent enzyme, partial [Rhizobiaceae bacterium]
GVIRRMGMQKADGGSNAFAQRIVVQLMQSNKMAHHIDEMIRQMRIHRDAMIAAFAKHIPEAEIRAPQGGYFLWAKLPESTDAEQLVEMGIEEGVEVSSGRLSFPNDDPGNFIRMAYSFITVDQTNDGIAKLGVAWRKFQSQAKAA